MYNLSEIQIRNINEIIERTKINNIDLINLLNEIDDNTWKLSDKFKIDKFDIIYLRKQYIEFAPHLAIINFVIDKINQKRKVA